MKGSHYIQVLVELELQYDIKPEVEPYYPPYNQPEEYDPGCAAELDDLKIVLCKDESLIKDCEQIVMAAYEEGELHRYHR